MLGWTFGPVTYSAGLPRTVAEKAKEMTEDERDQGKEQVQKLLKTYEDKVTDLADKKAKEIMEQ